jgi:hypothetical protein
LAFIFSPPELGFHRFYGQLPFGSKRCHSSF